MGLAGYLGHRVAQPQAVLSVPVGDARVRWGGRNGAWTFQSTFGFGVGGQECPRSVVRRGVFQEVWAFEGIDDRGGREPARFP
jgi:hypothetical protein